VKVIGGTSLITAGAFVAFLILVFRSIAKPDSRLAWFRSAGAGPENYVKVAQWVPRLWAVVAVLTIAGVLVLAA
jgi:hypothetical protein